MRNKTLLILEIIWIITGAASIAAAIRTVTTTGGIKALIFFVMAMISFLFAMMRHRQRKKS